MKKIEMVRIVRTVGGCFLQPQDATNHPLLTELHGDAQDVGKFVEGTIPDLLAEVRDIAKGMGISVQVCGNRKTAPVLYLRRKAKAIRETPAMVFAGLGGDAAHWGLSDFYDENAQALRQVLACGQAFDTGWFTAKKEIQTGRISRLRRNGPICVEVSVEMDEGADLVDTAIWKAAGGNAYSDGGFDALTKLGLSEARAYKLIDHLANDLGGISSESDSCIRHWKTGYNTLLKSLDELTDGCGKTLEDAFEGLVDQCKFVIKGLREEANASCLNCKMFSPGIPESRHDPADPADCGHPKYYALLSANKYFPFQRGCKYWTSKR